MLKCYFWSIMLGILVYPANALIDRDAVMYKCCLFTLLLSLSLSLCLSLFLPHTHLPSQKSGFMGLRSNAKYILIHSTTVPHTVEPQLCVMFGNKNVELSTESDKITSRWNWWCFVIIITLSTNFKRDTLISLYMSMNWRKDSKRCRLSVCALF